MASLSTISTTFDNSVSGRFMNLSLGGVLKKRSFTSISVPGGDPASSTPLRTPPSTLSMVPIMSECVLVIMRNRETLAMLGMASPLKPSDVSEKRSFTSFILLVACRSRHKSASSRVIPSPSSDTLISLRPPDSSSISIEVLPASMEFSTSSFTTDAGLSTISPAAILETRLSDNTLIFPIW